MINNESLGAHIRNMLTPYATLVHLFEDLQSGKEKKAEFAKDALNMIDAKDLADNLNHLIDISKIDQVEAINWRGTDLFKSENEEKLPNFSSCKEWVESLPYDIYLYEYKGKKLCNGKGFEWTNPYNSFWGAPPQLVFDRLFKNDHYYGLTENELTELRTTIQYYRVYLNDYFNKMINMMKELGFEIYKKQGQPDDLIHIYMKRGNISVYFSNLTTPQDFMPNCYHWQWGFYKTGKNGRKYRVLLDSDLMELQDDFGEKTKQWVEIYIKENLSDYASM